MYISFASKSVNYVFKYVCISFAVLQTLSKTTARICLVCKYVVLVSFLRVWLLIILTSGTCTQVSIHW